MSVVFRGCAMLGLFALAACSSGGSSSSPSYTQLMSSQAAFLDGYLDDRSFNDDLTPVSRMPRSGTASYQGTGSVTLGRSYAAGAPQVAGQANLNADFSNSEISGRVTDFKAAPGHRTTGGNIRVDGQIIENVMIGSARGNVNVDGRTHGMSDSAIGVFLERDASAVNVASDGTTSRGSSYITVITATKD